jgi:hypothetical protein
MNYFLIARDGWHMPAEELARILRSQWPSVEMDFPPRASANRSLEFWLQMMESPLHGALNREGSTLIFMGAMRDCARFALWYQEKVPEACPLLLCDEGYNSSITLQPETTAEDILRALGYIPPS